ncbi:MAG: type III-B CRISPR-associated protein Cas10/Cmr2 [Bacteroidetes bacterium]|nr:MAG: type III-B CRISPR-associated protein Cas10/Cmr2 [Bacteroidota bacterium]
MKYTAITIGPIYKTLQLARSTKAVWSASYLFSYLMKQIYKEVITEIKKEAILLPFISDDMLQERIHKKVGLFPDRIIFEGTLKDFEALRERVVSNLANIITQDIQKEARKEIRKDTIKKHLKHYLTIKAVSKEIEAGTGNAVEIMNEYLTIQELQQQTSPSTFTNCLSDFFELRDNGYNTFIQNEFERQPFKSISEIATSLLNHTIREDNQDTFYLKLEQECKDYKPIHKYIAVVQADGDNIGSLITKLGEKSKDFKRDIRSFSEKLYHFSLQALEIINKWKGTPIYVGGDDLLFFAPVAEVKNQKTEKTILNICNEISGKFDTLITQKYTKLKLKKDPTISFGINISYYKFPLDQSLKLAYKQLSKAKEGNKNAIALNITKHSGQSFEAVFQQDKKSFTQLTDFLKQSEKPFFANFMYKLETLKTIFNEIGSIEEEEKEKEKESKSKSKSKSKNKRNDRFKAFYNNFFNEDIHKESKKKDGFLDNILELTKLLYTENNLANATIEEREQLNEKNIATLYGGLRYYHFIHAKKE